MDDTPRMVLLVTGLMLVAGGLYGLVPLLRNRRRVDRHRASLRIRERNLVKSAGARPHVLMARFETPSDEAVEANGAAVVGPSALEELTAMAFGAEDTPRALPAGDAAEDPTEDNRALPPGETDPALAEAAPVSEAGLAAVVEVEGPVWEEMTMLLGEAGDVKEDDLSADYTPWEPRAVPPERPGPEEGLIEELFAELFTIRTAIAALTEEMRSLRSDVTTPSSRRKPRKAA